MTDYGPRIEDHGFYIQRCLRALTLSRRTGYTSPSNDHPVRVNDVDIQQQVALLKRGTLGVTPENGLEEKLAKSQKTGNPLKVKLGLDPTAPDIHLGFAVVLRKLRQFQDLGHQVIIIIGDYTALIGDPSGRSATRPMLTTEEIKTNAHTYVDQLARILDREKTTVRFNSEWLGALTFADVVQLASRMTVAQVMEREDFANRFEQHQPISLHELLYPLSQAYDSVAIEADVEMGGQDQMFNILAGRDLQRDMGQEPQVALYMPLLVGLDGVKKMSKSLGNYVGITERPDIMFGKLMSISDDMMETYFELCTDVPMEDVRARLTEAKAGKLNPMEVKRRLAREIVTIYHGAEAAKSADEGFGKTLADFREFAIPADILKDGKVWVCRLLVSAGLAKGTGDARRLIEQRGVKMDGEKLTDVSLELPPSGYAGKTLQVGSLHAVKIVG
jgi:tyrosyl-tRNA synthetase